MPKLRAEIEGPDGPVFITRDGEVVQQTISSLVLTLTNGGRYLTVGHPIDSPLGLVPYEAQASYQVGKVSLTIDYEEI